MKPLEWLLMLGLLSRCPGSGWSAVQFSCPASALFHLCSCAGSWSGRSTSSSDVVLVRGVCSCAVSSGCSHGQAVRIAAVAAACSASPLRCVWTGVNFPWFSKGDCMSAALPCVGSAVSGTRISVVLNCFHRYGGLCMSHP